MWYYVPGTGQGKHIDYLELFKKVQKGGKAVQVHGSPEEIKFMHRELRPEKAFYCTNVGSQAEAEELVGMVCKEYLIPISVCNFVLHSTMYDMRNMMCET